VSIILANFVMLQVIPVKHNNSVAENLAKH